MKVPRTQVVLKTFVSEDENYKYVLTPKYLYSIGISLFLPVDEHKEVQFRLSLSELKKLDGIDKHNTYKAEYVDCDYVNFNFDTNKQFYSNVQFIATRNREVMNVGCRYFNKGQTKDILTAAGLIPATEKTKVGKALIAYKSSKVSQKTKKSTKKAAKPKNKKK